MTALTPDVPLEEAAAHVAAALRALGLDQDPEMARTGAQVAGLWASFRPVDPPLPERLPTRSYSPILLRSLPYHSLCAHHLLPFFGTVTIGLRPQGVIAGLGWYSKVVEAICRRPQLQERVAAELAHWIDRALEPRSVVVCLQARQMCVEMRAAHAASSYEIWAHAGLDDPELVGLVRSGG